MRTCGRIGYSRGPAGRLFAVARWCLSSSFSFSAALAALSMPLGAERANRAGDDCRLLIMTVAARGLRAANHSVFSGKGSVNPSL